MAKQNKMKKIIIIVVMLFSIISTFGQQILWATIEGFEAEYVRYENVTSEVLELYDLYDRYYDLSGNTKESFLEEYSDNIEEWNWVNDIEESTVFSLRIPTDMGSVIYVLYVDKNFVNLVSFSNAYFPGGKSTYNGQMADERKRFEKWFKTLLN